MQVFLLVAAQKSAMLPSIISQNFAKTLSKLEYDMYAVYTWQLLTGYGDKVVDSDELTTHIFI